MQVDVAITDAAAARAFYDARYARGYMDCWDAERHARLREVLARIELPPRARILDYGCGSGALTALLAERWPDAEVIGADVSVNAIASARVRHAARGVRFEVLDAAFVRGHAGAFHFVWSHHVLEHVVDLESTAADLARLTAPGGTMLHVLPCGNAGSLPHWLCTQRRDGIDAAAGNRFFFEDPGHLRRLSSAELQRLFAAYGATATGACFACHTAGSVRLFTEFAPRELLALLDPRPCRPGRLGAWLLLAIVLAALFALRAPAQVLVRWRRRWHQVVRLHSRRLLEPSTLLLALLALPALLLLPVSLPVEALVRHADRREWRTRRTDPRGAEMFLCFQAATVPASRSVVRASELAGGRA